MVARNPISRGNLTNQQWQRLQALLPKPSPQGGQPAKDHRTIINGILWILRTGAPIALRAFKKGATYQTAMALGRPFRVAFMRGVRVDAGSSF